MPSRYGWPAKISSASQPCGDLSKDRDWPLPAATALRQSLPCVLAEVIASSQTLTSRSSVSVDGGVAPHHQSPTSAMEPAGQDLGAPLGCSGLTTVPLQSRPNASPFWIMLLLVLRDSERGMIPTAFYGSATLSRIRSLADYAIAMLESSFRKRQCAQIL